MGVTHVYTSHFKLRSQKQSALHIAFYTETVKWSDYKIERSGLERSEHGTKWPLYWTLDSNIPLLSFTATEAKFLSLTLLSGDHFKVNT